jgi:hypothetical protein
LIRDLISCYIDGPILIILVGTHFRQTAPQGIGVPELDVMKDMYSMRLKIENARWPETVERCYPGSRRSIALHQYVANLPSQRHIESSF